MTDENSPLRILVLHRLGSPKKAPHFLSKLVYSLKNFRPNNQYLYHDVSLPLPGYVKEATFDAIILDVTFLAARWGPPGVLAQIQSEYAFVRDAEALKIALPQDEYDCHLILDDWLCRWKVDVVYSVIDDHWPILFPRYHRQGEIRLGYTGYIDESLLGRPVKKWEERRIDIGYRARLLPPYFGRIGEVKGRIGGLVAEKAQAHGLVADIQVGDAGTIVGEKWLDFLGDSRFTLGTNSGSSLLDPTGEIQRAVRKYLREHPAATFEEVERQCFAGLDGRYQMTAISPRIFEAALMGSGQILVRGTYSGMIQPWVHYLPLTADASDFDEVYRAMRDREQVDRMIGACRSALLDIKALRISHAANELLDLVRERSRVLDTNRLAGSGQAIIDRYEDEMAGRYLRLWRRQEVRAKVVQFLKKTPSLFRILWEIREKLRPGGE
jgi:uncharacterized membrane protein YeaQ/YmgE (transglycosylase-associated protein family)